MVYISRIAFFSIKDVLHGRTSAAFADSTRAGVVLEDEDRVRAAFRVRSVEDSDAVV